MLDHQALTVTQLYREHCAHPAAVDLVIGTEPLNTMKEMYRQHLARDDDFELLTLPEEDGGAADHRQALIESALGQASKNALLIRRTIHSYPELLSAFAESPIFQILNGRLRNVYHIRPKPPKQELPPRR